MNTPATTHRNVRAQLPGMMPRLWRFAYMISRSRDAADDLVQATCVRAIEREHQYRDDGRFDSWLFAIANSIWLNQLRAARVRQGHGFVDAEQALSVDGERETHTNIFARQVLSSIERLPEAQRAAVLLVYAEGFSYREAADTLSVPIGTIMSRLAAARKSLASLNADSSSPAGVKDEKNR